MARVNGASSAAVRSARQIDLDLPTAGTTWHFAPSPEPAPESAGAVSSTALLGGCMCSACAQYLSQSAAATTWTPVPGVTYITDPAEAYKALLFPGNALGPHLAINPGNLGKSAFVTYSLAAEIPPSLRANMLAEFGTTYPTQVNALIASFQDYRTIAGGPEKIRAALDAFTAVTGLIFLEVDAGKGEMEFAALDFGLVPGLDRLAGFAQPANGNALENSAGADVTMRISAAVDFAVLLHEIGHAVGLQHPFDGLIRLRDMSTEGNPDLTTLDTKENTVMSYKGYQNPQPATPYLGQFDIRALKELYGTTAPTSGSGAGQYQWNAATRTLTQYGSTAADTLFGTASDDVILGGDGNDTLDGKNGVNILEGGAGNDILKGGTGNDTLRGGNDNDTLSGGGGIDTLDGGGGDDTMTLTVGSSIDGIAADGGSGTDGLNVYVAPGLTSLNLDLSKLNIRNTETATFWATAGSDTLSIDGQNSGTTTVLAFAGDDTLTALAGGTGTIVLNGGEGNDVLNAGAGANVTLVGENGSDRLIAGSGLTEMWGGAGADRYVFAAATDSTAASEDVVKQFEFGVDKIELGFVPSLVTFERPATGTGTLVKATHNGVAFQLRVEATGLGASDFVLPAGAPTLFRTVYTANPAGETLFGTPNSDTLNGSDGNDILNGLGGGDWLFGGGGNDTLWVPFAKTTHGYVLDGGAGTGDRLVLFFEAPASSPAYLGSIATTGIESVQVNGSSGADHLVANFAVGSYGSALVFAGDGNDVIEGRAIFSQFDGGSGADTIYAGTGKNLISAGRNAQNAPDAEADTIVFRSPATTTNANFAQIYDFTSGSDKIRFNFAVTNLQAVAATDNGVATTHISGTAGGTNIFMIVFGTVTLTDIEQVLGTTVKVAATGATVWQDSNGDGLAGATESIANSGAAGSVFFAAGGSGALRANGGTNINSGLAMQYGMSAPAGATAINMLTTLVERLMTVHGLQQGDASTRLRTSLGLDPAFDVLGADLTAAGVAGSAAALKAMKAAAQLESIVTANLAAGTSGSTADSLLASFALAIRNGQVLDLTQATGVSALGSPPAISQQVVIANAAIASAATGEAVAAAQRAGASIGHAGNDGIFFGSAFGAGDVVNGGGGQNDQLGLQGDYSGGITLSAAQLTGVEVVALLPTAGAAYRITTTDDLVAATDTLTFYASELAAGQNFTLNGAAETSGAFRVFGGLGTDVITTGGGNDGIYFGQGRFGAGDSVNGGAGSNDQLALDGDYTVTLTGAQVQNIEVLALLEGRAGINSAYNVTLADSLLAGAQTLTVWAVPTRAGVVVNGSVEATGAFTMYGGSGNDTLTGGAGNDRLTGNGGNDTLTGGAGADRFVFEGNAALGAGNVDTITDFARAQGDTVQLSAALFTAMTAGGLAPGAFLSAAGATAATTADQRIIYNSTTGALYYDPDGTGGAFTAVQFATLTGAPALQNTDFLIVV